MRKKKEAQEADEEEAEFEPVATPSGSSKRSKRSKGKGKAPQPATPEPGQEHEDHDNDAEEGSASGGSAARTPRKGRGKGRDGLTVKQQKREDALMGGPFVGKLRFCAGDDLESRIERSMAEPTDEMMANREFIWKICERCASHLQSGTCPQHMRYKFVPVLTDSRSHLCWRYL